MNTAIITNWIGAQMHDETPRKELEKALTGLTKLAYAQGFSDGLKGLESVANLTSQHTGYEVIALCRKQLEGALLMFKEQIQEGKQ